MNVLLTGATGKFGQAILSELNDWNVYTLQPEAPKELSKWLNCDLMEPGQTVRAVHTLCNLLEESKLKAVIHAAEYDFRADARILNVFDLEKTFRLHVFEPFILTKYLVEFGLIEWNGVAIWLDTSMVSISWVAKTTMEPVISSLTTMLPSIFQHKFIKCEEANRIGATQQTAKEIRRLLCTLSQEGHQA